MVKGEIKGSSRIEVSQKKSCVIHIHTEEGILLLLVDEMILHPLIRMVGHKVEFLAVETEREVVHLTIHCLVALGTYLCLTAKLDTKAASCSCHTTRKFVMLLIPQSILHFMTTLQYP